MPDIDDDVISFSAEEEEEQEMNGDTDDEDDLGDWRNLFQLGVEEKS